MIDIKRRIEGNYLGKIALFPLIIKNKIDFKSFACGPIIQVDLEFGYCVILVKYIKNNETGELTPSFSNVPTIIPYHLVTVIDNHIKISGYSELCVESK